MVNKVLIYVGGTCLCILGVVILVVSIACCLRRKRQSKINKQTNGNGFHFFNEDFCSKKSSFSMDVSSPLENDPYTFVRQCKSFYANSVSDVGEDENLNNINKENINNEVEIKKSRETCGEISCRNDDICDDNDDDGDGDGEYRTIQSNEHVQEKEEENEEEDDEDTIHNATLDTPMNLNLEWNISPVYENKNNILKELCALSVSEEQGYENIKTANHIHLLKDDNEADIVATELNNSSNNEEVFAHLNVFAENPYQTLNDVK